MDLHDGNRVRVLLHKQEWNQVKFAKAMGIPRSTFMRMLDQPHWKARELVAASQLLKVNLLASYLKKGKLTRGRLVLTDENERHTKVLLLSDGEGEDM